MLDSNDLPYCGIKMPTLMTDIIESLWHIGIDVSTCKQDSDGRGGGKNGMGMISFNDAGSLEATVSLLGKVLEDFSVGDDGFDAYVWSENSEHLIYVLTLPVDSMVPIGVMLKDHLGLDSAMCDDCRAELFGSGCEEGCPDCDFVRQCTEADLANEKEDDDPPCATGRYFESPTL